MKLVISKAILENAIKTGGLAAFTEEGQRDDIRIKDATKSCVMLSVEESGVTFRSTVSNIAASFIVPVGDNAQVITAGSVCIPVKDLATLISKWPKDSTVRLTYVPLENADSIDHSKAVQSSGVVVVESLVNNEPVLSGEFEAYPSSEFEDPNLAYEAAPSLTGKAGALQAAFGRVEFAINSYDLGQVLNKVGMEQSEDKLFMLGTDGRRAALISIKKSDFSTVDLKDSILADASLLRPALKAFDESDDISVIEENDKLHIIIRSSSTSIRIVTAEREAKTKFSAFWKIKGLKTPTIFELDREDLIVALESVAVANRDRSKYSIPQGEKCIQISGKGAAGIRGVKAKVKCEAIQKSLRDETICLSTSYFLDSVKRLSGSKIILSFSDDEKKAKVESVDDPDFVYFMQRMFDHEL